MAARKALPSRYSIAQRWFPEFVEDLSSPACFACNWAGVKVGEYKSPVVAWNSLRLERCHIVAASIGGSSDLSNLVLLCSRCHREAPMTANRTLMLQWMRTRESYIDWFSRTLVRSMLDFKISDHELRAVGDITPSDLSVKRCTLKMDKHPSSTDSGLITGLVAVARTIIDERLEAARVNALIAVENGPPVWALSASLATQQGRLLASQSDEVQDA